MSEAAHHPAVLIEDWLPIAELGAESLRERAVFTDLPPLFALHLWWARRPIAATNGVVLASLLPPWSKELASAFPDSNFADENSYRRWFLRLCGTWSDVVTARRLFEAAKLDGKRIPNPYGHARSFKNAPSQMDLAYLDAILQWTWGDRPTVTDPTAGGGTIPFVAARYGLDAFANDLNGVAAATLRAGVELPVRYGLDIFPHLEKYGEELARLCSERLRPFYSPHDSRAEIVGYIYANAVNCPRRGKLTPLVPDWWVSSTGEGVAIFPITERDGIELDELEFEVRDGSSLGQFDPSAGTYSGGSGISIWDDLPIDAEYIKSEASQGRLSAVLYAVAVKNTVEGGARTYRAPTDQDMKSLHEAEAYVDSNLDEWLDSGLVPDEAIPEGNKTAEPLKLGIGLWRDLFTKRQLLAHATFVEVWRELQLTIIDDLGVEDGNVVSGLLCLMQGKALNWNSRLSSWDKSVNKIRSVFDSHNLAVKMSFAEFDGAGGLWPWTHSQLLRAYGGICRQLTPGTGANSYDDGVHHPEVDRSLPSVSVTRGNAATLDLGAGTQTLVCIDPPYYNNVMYAELSDFFGVWEQHTIGEVWPDLLDSGLADVANEAVANVHRFKEFGRRKKTLADADYNAKMASIFVEAGRVLRPGGVLAVMFTHKRAEAWDALGRSLMEAGFVISTSWPVQTEPEKSLHIAKKNAAASTIMLVCRKRGEQVAGERFFEDLLPEVKAAARDAVERFEKDGIAGVDLLLSTYGPVLSVISGAWPVYSSEVDESGKARLLRPEEALDVAREELIQARRRALVGRQVTFDPVTDFWLISWELFQAEEFPYDEARRLALAVGGQDPEGLASAGVLKKKSGSVVLQKPADRRRRVLRPVQDGEIEGLPLVDVLHGVMVIAEVDGLGAGKAAMDRLGLTEDARFVALVQGAVNALPFGKKKGQFIRPEAETLHGLVTAYLPSVELPEEEPPTELFPE